MHMGSPHMFGHGALVIAGHGAPFSRHLHAANIDRQTVAFGRFARFADGHNNASPIGILARHGGFHQR